MSLVDALWAAGYLKTYDVVVAVLFILLMATAAIVKVVRPDVELMPFMMAMMMVISIFTLSVVYRCMWFVLQTRADVKLIANEAANLAVKKIQNISNDTKA